MKLDIDETLYSRLERRAYNKGFGSAEEYSEFVLETVIEELRDDESSDVVESRLKDLGYID